MPDTKKTLLIIEDDKGLRSQLRWHFDQYQVICAEDRASAITAIRRSTPPVILQDLGLPPDENGVEEGFRTIQEILQLAPETKIIVITGYHDYENALRAVSLGAHDFYQKPLDTNSLDLIVKRAFQLYQLENESRQLHDTIMNPPDGLIASDEKMKKICRLIEKIGPTNTTCLLLGESGTGKEVISRALHNASQRNKQRFVAINCAAVPEALMESELFGYEKGAFTGATKTTPGKIETANGGTLFLDEIGDMPLPLQAKLLRFLQERIIERVGGRDEIKVDTRVICATNKNIEKMVSSGDFREDLYYRISEFVIHLPPLRERTSDKIFIARYLLKKFSSEYHKTIRGFSTDATLAIESHEWPGNIREMENKIKRAVIMSEGKFLTAADIGLNTKTCIDINLRKIRQEAEISAIKKALSISNFNLTKASSLLGITRPTLYDLIRKYGINIIENSHEMADSGI